jgi:large subunit ribosomal protein L17
MRGACRSATTNLYGLTFRPATPDHYGLTSHPATPPTSPLTTMRHQRQRYQLSRSSAHRKSLLMNLSKEVIEHERIQTTETKAKAVKPELEKLITLGKRGDLHARRQALSALGQDKFAVYKLFEEIAPRYEERHGGYTRILKLGPRRSDSTEMVLLELV